MNYAWSDTNLVILLGVLASATFLLLAFRVRSKNSPDLFSILWRVFWLVTAGSLLLAVVGLLIYRVVTTGIR